MPSPPAWNRTTPRAVGVAVLLAVAVWAGEVRAGCGDHVVILSKTATAEQPAPSPPPPPCQGPHCSLERDAPAPLLPAPSVPKPLPSDAILLAAPANDLPACGRVPVAHLFPDSGHPADIFHPPRRG